MKTLEHVLLIDDNEEDNEFHEIIINDSEIAKRVTSIFDALKAIDFLKNILDTSKTDLPELIFLDVMMPRMDGYELLNTLKDLFAGLKEKPRVFILSGIYNPAIETFLHNPDYTDFVMGYRVKPLTKVMLTEIIEKYF